MPALMAFSALRNHGNVMDIKTAKTAVMKEREYVEKTVGVLIFGVRVDSALKNPLDVMEIKTAEMAVMRLLMFVDRTAAA